MYTISVVSEMTGVSTHTLRYYEKIGLLPKPGRNNGGIRVYTESDVQFIQFLNSLKLTGMSLEDMTEFVQDGCILQNINIGKNVTSSLEIRVEILTKHLAKMEKQRQELDHIMNLTKEKLSTYHSILARQGIGEEGDEI